MLGRQWSPSAKGTGLFCGLDLCLTLSPLQATCGVEEPTLIVDNSADKQSQQSLPNSEALEDGGEKTGGLKEPGRDDGISRGRDKAPIDGGHVGQSIEPKKCLQLG